MKREQIEKAAKEAEKYSRKRMEENERYKAMFTRSEIKQAFEDGAEWRINSVWHDTKEEPKRGVWLLAQIGDGSFDIIIVGSDGCNWDELSDIMNIMRWAYVSDLMPD